MNAEAVVATSAAVVLVMTEATVLSVQIAHHAKMANHPSRVSQEVIVLRASLEPTAHRANRVQKDKSNVHRVNRALLANHVLKAKNSAKDKLLASHAHQGLLVSHVLIVQICANHARAMRQQKPKHHKL